MTSQWTLKQALVVAGVTLVLVAVGLVAPVALVLRRRTKQKLIAKQREARGPHDALLGKGHLAADNVKPLPQAAFTESTCAVDVSQCTDSATCSSRNFDGETLDHSLHRAAKKTQANR